MKQLDSYLQALPRYIPIDDMSAIDVTVPHDPLVSATFLSVGAKGEFMSLVNPLNFTFPAQGLPSGLSCSDSAKMITVAVSDYVINSAGAVYYEVLSAYITFLK